LENGNLQLLIGTHALLEDKVKFQNLGLAVLMNSIVLELSSVLNYGRKMRFHHTLVMTALFRTLAMSLYGDLDISPLSMSCLVKTIQTVHRFDNNLKVWKFRDEIGLGHKIYIVYPLIQESAKMDFKDLMDGYESVSRDFPLPDYSISIFYGKMKPADKDAK
jgi:ATP-dependent DNA helicase RecG